jgi:hypothetical protein
VPLDHGTELILDFADFGFAIQNPKSAIENPNRNAEAVRLELTSDSIGRHLFSRQAPHPAG